jgi:hypothetical protein
MQPEEKVEVTPDTIEVSATSENVQEELPEISILDLEEEIYSKIMEIAGVKKVTSHTAINALMNSYIKILSYNQTGEGMVDTILQHSRAIIVKLIPVIIEHSKKQPVVSESA